MTMSNLTAVGVFYYFFFKEKNPFSLSPLVNENNHILSLSPLLLAFYCNHMAAAAADDDDELVSTSLGGECAIGYVPLFFSLLYCTVKGLS